MKMERVPIEFGTIEEAVSFVMAAERSPYPVLLDCGEHIVDGKSLIGVLSYGVSGKVHVIYKKETSGVV